MKRWNAMLIMAGGLTVAACDRSGTAGGGAAAGAGAQKVIVAADEDAHAAPRSIMRPTVAAAEPAPPPPAPTQVTIPFGTPGPSGKPATGLDDAQRATLDALATRLAATRDTLVVRGSTDSHGSDRRNRLVSLRRARLVAHYLESKAIADDRIQLVALGEDRPIAPNAKPDGSDDPDARARNRRVDIEIVPAPASAPAPAPTGSDDGHPAVAPGKS